MLNKKRNITIILVLLILLLINFSLFSQEQDDAYDSGEAMDPADSTELYDDPAVSLPEPEISDSTSEQRYTDVEFANLSDEEKKNIYFNFPQLLPENFNPDVYMHIFHPQSEDME